MTTKKNHREVTGVAMIIARFWPDVGGAENQARLLSKYLVDQGVNVTVFTRNYHQGQKLEKLDGISILRSRTFKNFRVLNSLSYILTSIFYLFKKRQAFDVIHCRQSYSPLTIGILAKLLLKKPVVLKMTASNEYGEVNELKRLPFFRLRKFFLKMADKIFVVNTGIREELKSIGVFDQNTMWLPNGVVLPVTYSYDRETKKNARANLKLPQDQKILIFTGRLSEEKGLDILLNTWKKIEQQSKHTVQLIIVGDGGVVRNVEEKLRNMRTKLGIEKSVLFTGRVENVYPYLLAANCFILPSVSEGMSNSLLEAMASGLPVIVTDIPASKELVNDGQEGIVIPYGDEARMHHSIVRIFDDEELERKMGQAARKKIENEFEIGLISSRILSQYREVLNLG